MSFRVSSSESVRSGGGGGGYSSRLAVAHR